MNQKEKLIEATIKALQGKLIKEDLSKDQIQKIKNIVKEMAEDDWSAGTPFSIDDLNEFIHILKDEGYTIPPKQGAKLFDYYFECYDDARYENNI